MGSFGTWARGFGALALLSLAAGCAAPPAPPTAQERAGSAFVQRGLASWYGPGFHGRKTASGERFNQNAMTAAHRTLPLGCRVRVRYQETGETVRVRINDRGPYKPGRVIDLSRAAAQRLGIVDEGLARVTVEADVETADAR